MLSVAGALVSIYFCKHHTAHTALLKIHVHVHWPSVHLQPGWAVEYAIGFRAETRQFNRRRPRFTSRGACATTVLPQNDSRSTRRNMERSGAARARGGGGGVNGVRTCVTCPSAAASHSGPSNSAGSLCRSFRLSLHLQRQAMRTGTQPGCTVPGAIHCACAWRRLW